MGATARKLDDGAGNEAADLFADDMSGDGGHDDTKSEAHAQFEHDLSHEAPADPAPEKSVWESLLDTAGDAASGINEGVTGGFDERLPFGIGDAIKADRAKAYHDSPMVTPIGRVAGMLALPEAKVVKGAGIGAAAANAGATAAAQGVYSRTGHEDEGHTLEDYVNGASKDAVTGFGVGGALSALGHASGAVGEGLDTASNFLRGKVFSPTAGDISDMIAKHGTTRGLEMAETGLGKLPEELGLTNRFKPQNAADYARKLEPFNKNQGIRVGKSLDAAGHRVPEDSADFAKDDVLRKMAAARKADQAAASGKGVAGPMADLEGRLQDMTPSTPREIHGMKRDYEDNSYAAGPGSMERGAARANKISADATRGALDDVMRESGPDNYQAFKRASDKFDKGTLLEELAGNAAGHQLAGRMVSAGMGGSVGGIVGYEMGGWEGGVAGAVAGAGLGAAAGAPLGSYAPDASANMAKLGSAQFGAVGRGLNYAAGKSAPIVAAADNGPDASTPHQQMTQAMQASKGYATPDKIKQALVREPASLGPYRGQFESAGKTPDGISALLTKLQNTDQTWRTQYAPLLHDGD